MRRPRKEEAASPKGCCGACPRSIVAAAVARAVRAVIEDYLRFLLDEGGGTDAAKAFMARQAAARSALAHVETLLKLVGGPGAAPDEEFHDGFVLLGQAREALAGPLQEDAAAEEGAPDGETAPG